MLYASTLDQAWLRYWVSVMPDSRLSHLLREPPPVVLAPPLPAPPQDARSWLRPTPAPPARPPPRPRVAKPSQPKKPRPPAERAERRIARDIERVTRLPVSEWAKSIVGDPRNDHIRLEDILDGVEDYFEVFEQMRRTAPEAYQYFSKIGAPVFTAQSAIWTAQVEALTVATPEQLPSFFGVFFAHTQAEYRERILDDAPTLLDFHLFEKPKNHATIAPLGSTIFAHTSLALKRNGLTPEERRKFPSTRRNWGVWWYVGVLPDGSVRALPHRMTHYQKLPSGDGIYHSAFHIPPGLYEAGGDKGPHGFVRVWFNIAVAATASAVSGVTVTIRQGKRAARLGVPVGNLKAFFADRDPTSEGARRRAIMHLRLGHDRHMADGRIIAVGEHLSGERHFTWRGYEITVGVPGLHFPSPEGFNHPVWVTNDPDAPLPDDVDPDKMAPITRLANHVQTIVRKNEPVPIRHGEPTRTYKGPTLQLPRR
jgi:hypothetical protein